MTTPAQRRADASSTSSTTLAAARAALARQPEVAAAAAHAAVTHDDRDRDAWNLLGQALSAMGRAAGAVSAFERAVSLAPDDGFAAANLAIAHLRAGSADLAVAVARRAVRLAPKASEVHAALGHALGGLGRPCEALDCFREALELRGNNADALLGIARIYSDMGQISTAILALLRALKLTPQSAWTHVELANLYRELGDFPRAAAARANAQSLAGAVSSFDSNALLDRQYDPASDDGEATRAAMAWGVRHVTSVPQMPRRSLKGDDAERILHVGYVSADLCRHPVGWLGGSAIADHDPAKVRVTIYANGLVEDDVTARIRDAVPHWVAIHGLDDASVAAKIAADKVDVLVDMSGHTSGHRLGVFARRPAPIQVSWLGYVATTGCPAIDAVLFDAHHVPPGAEHAFSENVVRLAGLRHAYTPPPYAPAVSPPPMLAADAVTFGCFNNASKINDGVLRLWSRVLAAVPRSRLLLKWRSFRDPLLQARVRAVVAAEGVDPARLIFDGATPHRDMLSQYGAVDVALDPFPFSGALTTCEALWMGVPVVTLPGRRAVSRQTHAILHAIGRPEWSVASPDAYVAAAVDLVSDPPRLAHTRASLRGGIAASELCDTNRLARSLEAAYRELWRAAVARA